MINPGRSYNINDYREIFLRRRLYFIIPLVVVFLGACLWAGFAPRKYKASTLVLVTPQRVPSDLIRSTVTSSIAQRLNSISQEIMSRTRLEAIIDEFKLFQDEAKSMQREAVVELMRKNIKVDLPKTTSEGAGYFAINYTAKDPRIAAAVANKLSSLFIEENLKQREQQAVGTSEFLSSELKTTTRAPRGSGEGTGRLQAQAHGRASGAERHEHQDARAASASVSEKRGKPPGCPGPSASHHAACHATGRERLGSEAAGQQL